MSMFRTIIPIAFILILVTACGGQSTPTATAVAINKELVTVEISPTADAEEVAATRAAISPTPIPPSPTVIPTETPYIGIFIGEAQQEESFVNFTEPIFGPRITANQPTANARRCLNIAIDSPYLTAWETNTSVSQRLGCPIQGGFGFFGEVQVFETGVMYYYPDLNAIWAIRPLQDDITGEFDYLENPTDISTIGIQPPAGLLVPGDIFGDMWIGVEGLREEMGFARTEAQEVPLGLQRFENGTFLLDVTAGQVYALVVDGTVYGPFLTANINPAIITTPTPAGTGTAPESTPEITEEPQG